MDPSEYKHIVLGLLFLKYIEDAFEERREAIKSAAANPKHPDFIADPAQRAVLLGETLEDRDEYAAESVFWVPEPARWSHIRSQATQPTIGKVIDDAMDAIEKENRKLRGVLPKVFALPNLDKHNLGKLIDLVSGIGLGRQEHRDKDTLGRVYEYFLSKFASSEGRGGGEFYTPTSVVRLLVEMLEPYKGRVFDPCCGSGGMFVQSLKFIDAHNGQRKHLTVYGQESNRTTWRMAAMNLAIRGIEANLGSKHADSFHEDLHPDLRADFVLANPPFNISEWGGERLANDVRWRYGTPPAGNANFAWVQHFLPHLAPNGTAGFVLANGSMSSQQSGEGEIRRKLVEADLVDCIVACPGQLFYATQIPVCLWFLTKSKSAPGHRDRRGETLFLDARKLGRMETRVHRVLDPDDIGKIAGTYHAWRCGSDGIDAGVFGGGVIDPGGRGRGVVDTGGRGEGVVDTGGRGRGGFETRPAGAHGMDGRDRIDAGVFGGDATDPGGRGRGGFETRPAGAHGMDGRDRIDAGVFGRDRTDAGVFGGDAANSGVRGVGVADPGVVDPGRRGRGGFETRPYEDILGFCKSATTQEIAGHDFVLTPGRYVGAEEVEDDGEPFEAKMERLTAELAAQMAEGARLDEDIANALTSIGFWRKP